MSQPDLLNAIVKRSEKTVPLEQSQTRVEIDLTPNRPAPFKKWIYYVVSHRTEVKAELRVLVDSFEQGWVLHLRIEYVATTSTHGLPDKVSRTLVEALREKGAQEKENAQMALERHIGAWVNQYMAENGGKAEFIRQYERQLPALSGYIRTRAEREVGLDLIPRIRPALPGPEDPEFDVKPIERPVVIELQDYPTAINGTLSLSLAALPGAWAYVYYPGLEKLCNRLLAHTRTFMRSITLHQIHFGLEKVREALAGELDQLARAEGRTVQALKPPCSSPVSVETEENATKVWPITCHKTYSLIEYPHPIEVVCELKMELTNLGAFIAANAPKLERWLETTFGDVIQKHLLDVSYIELFRQVGDSETGFATFDRKIDQTKQAIRDAAHKIGFDAYSIALRTNLQFDELRREFKISIDRGEGEFEMSVPNCPAALDIEVTARISSEKIIKELFRQDADIKKVIRKELKDKVSNKLKETPPERYYIYFDGAHVKGQKSLVEELQDIIKAAMQNYDATVLTVSCLPSRTEKDLWGVYEALIREERQFNILAEMSQLEFNIVFRVDSVVPQYWYEFQTKRPTLDNVQTKVEHCVGEWLGPQSRNELLRKANDLVKGEMNQRVSASVEEEFGISVKITHLARLRSPEDDAFNEKVTGTIVSRIRGNRQDDETELANLQQQLQLLYDREKIVISAQTYDELPKLRDLIREKKDQLREVSERLRLDRMSEMMDRDVDVQIGSLGGSGVLDVPALPDPGKPRPSKSLGAAIVIEDPDAAEDGTNNGRR